jgi:YD repeat-containing protein
VTFTDASGVTTFSYDALGRTDVITAPVTSVVGYGYDATGQRTQLRYPDGSVVDYTYHVDGQLDAVRLNGALQASYGYDTAGRLATLSRANGSETRYAYDAADRLQTLTHQQGGRTVSQFTYGVDRAGLRRSVDEHLGGTTRTIAYTYDGLLRLTGADASSGTDYSYAYDLAGNRTGAWEDGVQTQDRSYNAANQVIGFSYDTAGNLISDGITTYTYDALHRQITASASARHRAGPPRSSVH